MAHNPFSRNIHSLVKPLTVNDVALVDDSKMTEEESNQLMFNLMRVLLFKPVGMKMFLEQYIHSLRDKIVLFDSLGIAQYILSFEIIESSGYKVNSFKTAPVLSRFTELSKLKDFIELNRLMMMPTNMYQVRVCLTHYVADCFVYLVRPPTTTKSTLSGLELKSNPNRVQIQQMNSFACGPVQGKLGAKTVGGRASNILTAVPSRVRTDTNSRLWILDGAAELYWLPTFEKITNPSVQLPKLMEAAYWFNRLPGNKDLTFMTGKGTTNGGDKNLEKRVELLEKKIMS